MEKQEKQMDLESSNKLIAEFMGIDVKNSVELFIPEHERLVKFKTTNGTFVSAIFKFNELNYRSSWDWLLPVVEKIFGTENNSSDWEKHYTQIHDSLWLINIESVWLSVVEFIKWYNKQKQIL